MWSPLAIETSSDATIVLRDGESEIVAERFKASTKKINPNWADATVSLQTGCRAYQVEQPGLSIEKKDEDKDNSSDD